MDTKTRINKILPIMKKIESHQEWNRLLFFISLGLACHALGCVGNNKKMTTYDYVGLIGCAATVQKGHSLRKKEEQGQKLWHILQTKSARQA